MSKPTPQPKVSVEVVASEKARAKPDDNYTPDKPVTVPMRIRRGNNEYDLVEVTFSAPSAVKVLRSRRSRMEVDYELKAKMMTFLGPNRFGPSEEQS